MPRAPRVVMSTFTESSCRSHQRGSLRPGLTLQVVRGRPQNHRPLLFTLSPPCLLAQAAYADTDRPACDWATVRLGLTATLRSVVGMMIGDRTGVLDRSQ